MMMISIVAVTSDDEDDSSQGSKLIIVGLSQSNKILLSSKMFCERSDLAKPASTLYLHNLTGSLEAAIRATNAQYQNPEILSRLDCRLLEVSSSMTCILVAKKDNQNSLKVSFT